MITDQEAVLRNGLYKVEYQSRADAGFGVAHLNDGKVWGGDSMFYFTGSFTENDGYLIVRVKADQHTDLTIGESMFGRLKNTVKLEGRCTETAAELEGRSDQVSGVALTVRLTWLAD